MPSVYTAFKENLVRDLDVAKDRRARGAIFDAAERALADAGYEPWVFYTAFIVNPEVNPSYRADAINRLHDPTRVPEGDAAHDVAASVVYVMLDDNSDNILRSQAFMTAGILRSHNPPIAMLPMPKYFIDRHFIPYAEVYRSEQPAAMLDHILHTAPTVAKLSAVHGGAYNSTLSIQLIVFRGAYPRAVEEIRQNNPDRFSAYGFVHPLEHLADVMDIAAKTGNEGLIRSLANDGITDIFNDVNRQRVEREIPDERVARYLDQRDRFWRVLG